MKKILTILCLFFLPALMGLEAQTLPEEWTLNDCISYAIDNNIQVQKSRTALLSAREDALQARARLLPTVSASVSQSGSYYPSGSEASVGGNYGLSSSWTLFDGGRRAQAVRQQELQSEIHLLGIEQSEIDLRIAVVQTYLQALYTKEAVGIALRMTETSAAQLLRAQELLRAGTISRVDLAQLESQHSTNKYQATVAQKNYDTEMLRLKQLLELDMATDMRLAESLPTEADVLRPLPARPLVYAAALASRPEMKSGQLSIDAARIDIQRAKAGYLPTLSLNAAIGSGYSSGGGTWGAQLERSLNGNAGISLSLPIYSNRDNRTAVNKARYTVTTQELNLRSARKSLLAAVEGIYLDAASSQTQYMAANERLRYVEESFRLTEEQFFLGMKNTLELLTERNNLLSAQQEALQSKYVSIMSIKLLDIYQGLNAP
ncbi:MAG: TolC family protein [Tannerellaceae bacterium]|jgi:outer membrane protein|nr:TolC family protein [Tannerellaceae bacterium]